MRISSVDRFDQPIALAADVRDVLAAVLRGHLAQLDQFLGARVERRRVDQRRADPERALFHLLTHERAHLVELSRRGLPILEADDVLADRRRADERRDVLRDAAPLELAQVLGQRRPGDVELDVAHALDERASSSPR